jgi:ribosome-associated translation inhibitor RaiA
METETMQTDPIISWHHMDPSPAVEAIIHKRIEALDHIHDRIIGCRVVLEAADKRKLTGREFEVHLHLSLPGKGIDVRRSYGQEEAEADLLHAVNASFTAAEKQLRAITERRQPQNVKQHAPILHGTVETLEPELGWGTLRGEDGRSVYFQRESLPDHIWPEVSKGSRFRYRAFEGDKGPYAVDLSLLD